MQNLKVCLEYMSIVEWDLIPDRIINSVDFASLIILFLLGCI
jgi:hypothetical protein